MQLILSIFKISFLNINFLDYIIPLKIQFLDYSSKVYVFHHPSGS